MMKTVAWMLVGLVGCMAMVGCEATAKSDKCEPGWQTTTSYEKVMSTQGQPSPIKPRQWPATVAEYTAPTVTHFGSYYDDPFVTEGDGNDTYGWTCMDLLAVAYSPTRFVINTVAIPVSMVKEPPCVLQCTNLDQPMPVCGCEKDERSVVKSEEK
jgi:hypothetical protein